jgi:hypothetical protein
MKHKTYNQVVNINLLHEELTAFPGYSQTVNIPSIGTVTEVYYSLARTSCGVEVGVRLDLDFPDTVLAKHVPEKKAKIDEDKEATAAKKQLVLDKLSITSSELKDLLK